MTMNHSLANSALRQYQQVKTGAAVEEATTHRLIQMLLDGALERLASAKGHIQRGDVQRKGEQIGKAIGIVGGLRASLDFEAGGALAANLEALYDYMERRLLQANLASDPAILDEVAGLLRQIKSAWDRIGD